MALIGAIVMAYFLGKKNSDNNDTIKSPIEQLSTTQVSKLAETPSPVEKKIDPNAESIRAKQTAEARALLQKKRIEAQYKESQQSKVKSATASKETKSNTAVNSLYQEKQSTNEKANSTQSQASNEPETQQSQPENNVQLGSIRDLPWSVQQKIPTLMYSEHVYRNQGSNYVVINNQRLVKGQQIGPNMIIESIISDGIIVKYGEFKFKVEALNSWINM